MYAIGMASDPKDIDGTKALRREFNRRGLDITGADLRVMHGVAYIRGTIKTTRETEGDCKSVVEIVARAIRQHPSVRDVVIDCTMRG